MAITKKDIEKLSTIFLTKKDAENFATKEDLKDLRNELNRYATRADLVEFKDDIIKRLDDLRTDKLMLVSRNR